MLCVALSTTLSYDKLRERESYRVSRNYHMSDKMRDELAQVDLAVHDRLVEGLVVVEHELRRRPALLLLGLGREERLELGAADVQGHLLAAKVLPPHAQAGEAARRAHAQRRRLAQLRDAHVGRQLVHAVEIEPLSGVYSFEARYNAGETRFYVPARIDPDVAARAAETALAAHTSLGLRHLSRVDLIIDGAGTPWFLEANVMPGLTETSVLPQALEKSSKAAAAQAKTRPENIAEEAHRQRRTSIAARQAELDHFLTARVGGQPLPGGEEGAACAEGASGGNAEVSDGRRASTTSAFGVRTGLGPTGAAGAKNVPKRVSALQKMQLQIEAEVT